MPRGEGDVRANYVYSPQLLLGLGNKKNVLSLSLSLCFAESGGIPVRKTLAARVTV
jgi:hypothetical protein